MCSMTAWALSSMTHIKGQKQDCLMTNTCTIYESNNKTFKATEKKYVEL